MQRPAPELLQADRYPMTFEIATRWGDLDHNGHVNNVAMATIFEESRAAFFRSLPEAWPPRGQRAMVVAVHLDYLAEAFYPAPVEMKIGVLEIGRSSWSLAGLARQEDRICALCLATIVCTEGGRPAAMPGGLRARFGDLLLRPAEARAETPPGLRPGTTVHTSCCDSQPCKGARCLPIKEIPDA